MDSTALTACLKPAGGEFCPPLMWSCSCLSQSRCHLAILVCLSGVYSRNIKSQGTPSLNLWRKMKTVIQRLYFSRVLLSWFYSSFWGTRKEMSEPQIQSLPYVLITDISMWCIFFSSCAHCKTGKLKSTSMRSVSTQKLLWPPKDTNLTPKMDYLPLWQDKEFLCADKPMILHPT